MLPMLVVKKIMSIIKQPSTGDNVRLRPFDITQLFLKIIQKMLLKVFSMSTYIMAQ